MSPEQSTPPSSSEAANIVLAQDELSNKTGFYFSESGEADFTLRDGNLFTLLLDDELVPVDRNTFVLKSAPARRRYVFDSGSLYFDLVLEGQTPIRFERPTVVLTAEELDAKAGSYRGSGIAIDVAVRDGKLFAGNRTVELVPVNTQEFALRDTLGFGRIMFDSSYPAGHIEFTWQGQTVRLERVG